MAQVNTSKTEEKLQKRIEATYKEAEEDIKKKMKDYAKKYQAKEKIYAEKVKTGEISQEDFDAWKAGQVFQGQQWLAKKEQIQQVIAHSNQIAVSMINYETPNVFGDSANFMSYELEKMAKVNFGFGLYDSQTVSNLIKNHPDILPKWKIDEEKDYKWNSLKLNNSITQGIIQGESLDQISERVAKGLSTQNSNTMKTFARTAMTGAQNAGRMYVMSEAKGMGINVLKVWIATLDSHTRDSHADMDGETQKVGDVFHMYLYKFSNDCRFPGDPYGPPAEVYNCRCTLGEEFEDYPNAKYQRYDNIDGKPIEGMSYKDWYSAKHKSEEMNKAQAKLDALQDKYDKAVGIDKVFSNIWSTGDKTYADWDDIKDSIDAKEDYFNSKIEWLKDKGYTDFSAFGDKEVFDLLSKYKDINDLTVDDVKALSDLFDKYGLDFSNANVSRLMDLSHKTGYQLLNKYQGHLAELQQLKLHGAEYSKLIKELNAAKDNVKTLGTTTYTKGFDPKAYTQARKDAAVRAKTSAYADSILRGVSGDVWRNASEIEKDAIFEYTGSYHKFNEPLRGIEYGTNRFLGVGKTDLNAGWQNNGKFLNAMTDIISKSTYKEDIWLRRGTSYSGAAKFLDIDQDLLRRGTEQQLQNVLLGKVVTEYGFMSCGSAAGTGFNVDVDFGIYTPAGTQMMYVEPFSTFGNGDGRGWDGKSTQSSFGSELETIIQQGTQYRVTKVERPNGPYSTPHIEYEVVDQSHTQRYTP